MFPRRGGVVGGSTINVFGERFDSSGTPTVTVGGNVCQVISFSSSKISCTLPGGLDTADVAVTTGVESATFIGGYRYITGLPPSTPVVRINVGGAAYTDSQGGLWEADLKNSYFAFGGSVGSRGATTATISGTSDASLYKTYRIYTLTKPGPYQYVMPVPAPGRYKVVLHFSETDPARASVGKRVMDIWVEGKLFRQGFDIATAAGGAFIATTLTSTVTVIDGKITVELKPVVHNPTISAIEVFNVGK